MRALFIGLVLGAIAVWLWYHTGGKIYITEIETITNVVTVTRTQIVACSITRTNEVWKTNIVETTKQPTKKSWEQEQPAASSSASKPPGQVTPVKSSSGSRPSSSVKPAAAPPPQGGGVMFNDGHGRSYRIVNGRRIYY